MPEERIPTHPLSSPKLFSIGQCKPWLVVLESPKCMLTTSTTNSYESCDVTNFLGGSGLYLCHSVLGFGTCVNQTSPTKCNHLVFWHPPRTTVHHQEVLFVVVPLRDIIVYLQLKTHGLEGKWLHYSTVVWPSRLSRQTTVWHYPLRISASKPWPSKVFQRHP